MTLQSEKISKVIHEKNLTWGWLMEHSDVSRSTLSQIKNGKNNATFSTMEKIADALNVSLDEFRTKEYL